MTLRFACTCGKVLEAPESAAGTQGRCPGCGQVLTVPAPVPGQPSAGPAAAPVAGAAASAEEAAAAVGRTCTVCQTSIAAGEAVSFCPECRLPYHAGCWTENGGCAAYGCALAPRTVKPAEPTGDEVARRGWGDTKKCPYCGETIRAAALKCKFCNEVFATADPLTREDIRRAQDARQRGSSDRVKSVIYFVASMLACPAPVTALLGAWMIWGNRKRFAELDATDKVLIGAGFGVSAVVLLIAILGVVLHAAGG